MVPIYYEVREIETRKTFGIYEERWEAERVCESLNRRTEMFWVRWIRRADVPAGCNVIEGYNH